MDNEQRKQLSAERMRKFQIAIDAGDAMPQILFIRMEDKEARGLAMLSGGKLITEVLDELELTIKAFRSQTKR
jgi:hypothetical protein